MWISQKNLEKRKQFHDFRTIFLPMDFINQKDYYDSVRFTKDPDSSSYEDVTDFS